MRSAHFTGLLTLLVLATGAQAHEATHRTAHKQIGKASIYSHRFQGRHMSDGQRFNVHSSAAASKTLPLGTEARVTNLKTGKSAAVTIKDRGPVPRGRIVDLTPHTATQIGLTRKEGIAPVSVVPTSLPQESAAGH
ncbi:septal ring lytic transglycosylase RlpA family protein [Lichenicoccus sp.]|uniref:septal ring lytic transglycosylase RlpA family protein n=1 Tax=Lichenicoccus sp. TaxID=2781899 RepID=UPI003D0F40FD